MKCDYCGRELKEGEEIINIGKKMHALIVLKNIKKIREKDILKSKVFPVNSMKKQYGGLESIIILFKIMGFILIFFGVGLVGMGFANGIESWLTVGFAAVIIIGGLFSIGIGEIFEVLIQIEKNTRKS